MDNARALLDLARDVAARLDPTLLVLVTDREELVKLAIARPGTRILLATSEADLLEAYGDRVWRAMPLLNPVSQALNVLPQAKELLLGAFFRGLVTMQERVLVLIATGDALEAVLAYDVAKDLELTHLFQGLDSDVDLRVVERVLKLSIELAREGREGHPVGTLFVLGDTETVLRHSRPAVLNPFEGHAEKDRNILDEALWETAKEFAQIDGAFVVRGDGCVISAGRYVDTEGVVDVQPGLGGRHIAAASITTVSRALAVVVSTSGTIRVFKGGRAIIVVGRQ